MFVCKECGSSFTEGGFCTTDGAELVDASGDPLLGQAVGSYRIASIIGAGGMGTVYRGVQPAIGSRVAIKVLSHDCAANKGLIERFFSEARAVNVIRHENIVNVLDLAFLADGRPYIVMEHLDGAPLSALMYHHGALPIGGLTRVAEESLAALGAAHAKGIVHRDMKPDNVFVTPSGHAKVLDFGIAKLKPELAAGSDATRTGALMGTPQYMSPEQARAQPADARADLYAIGVILFEGICGRRLFDAQSLYELLKLHVEQPPPSPRSLRPDLPPAYEGVILRALEKDPSRRFQTAKEFSEALASAARALPPDSWAPLSLSARDAPPPMSRTPGRAASTRSPSQAPTRASPDAPVGTEPMAPALAAAHVAPAATPHVGAGTVAGTSHTMASAPAAPAAPGRNPLPYFAIATCGVVALGGMGTCVALAAIGSQDDNRDEPAELEDIDIDDEEPDDELDPDIDDPDPGAPADTPGGFNALAFDPQAFLPKAGQLARKRYSDAKLIRFDVDGVTAKGTVNLTLSDHNVLYRFRSPRKSKRPASLPKNVEYEGDCVVYVQADEDGVRTYVPKEMGCGDPLLGPPRCTFKQAWQKARASGAPGGNLAANVGFWADRSGVGRWYFRVDKFSQFIADDC